ncbi:hypothetical protein [Jannaschia marina]|uniref:hypothetical protein n=1 Tax=Jannaschia marina TaxID=2741674 RepID=UPI0015CCB7CE|nr:hypothetical protein [Jannaschia marina]
MNASSTALGLFGLRLSLFLFMLLWALLKVTTPGSYAGEGIFASFYGINLGNAPVIAIGVLQIAFLLAFVAGLARTITTGGVLLMNAVTLLVSIPTIAPVVVGGGNILFAASLPVLGASLALFLMRDRDTFLSLSGDTAASRAAA